MRYKYYNSKKDRLAISHRAVFVQRAFTMLRWLRGLFRLASLQGNFAFLQFLEGHPTNAVSERTNLSLALAVMAIP